MNILVLNGSPKGTDSNTMLLTNTFIKGLNKKSENNIEVINISKKHIEHCLGCLKCLEDPEKKCIINDDISEITEKYLNSDLAIWSFPIYHHGVPSKMKAIIDRLLPCISDCFKYIIFNNDIDGKPNELGHKGKDMIISTYGLPYKTQNYDAVISQFSQICGKKGFEKIICSSLINIQNEQYQVEIEEYLYDIYLAGIEYSTTGFFSKNTREKLEREIFTQEFLKNSLKSFF